MKMLHGVTKGLLPTGVQGGTGVGAFYLHRALAAKFAMLQNHPLIVPIGMILAGHVLKKSKKLGTAGPALIGAGGYAGAQVFEVQKSVKAQQAAPAQTAGLNDGDTGALVSPGDIGALVSPSDIGDLETNPADHYADAYSL